jgi:hypothetical protein
MRTYAVINIAELDLIDFSQVEETSSNTIRKSIDETQFVIKWTQEPTFIADSTVIPVGIYDHHAILELMASDKWSEPIEI